MADENVSVDDINWLVENRSRNQRATYLVYEVYQQYSALFMLDDHLRLTAQRLTSASFSLWRAVFLSNIENRKDLQVKDSVHFLENLLLHNSVTYSNDQNAKNFTFRYYVQHARDRLEEVHADKKLNLLPDKMKLSINLSAREWWNVNQTDLEKATTAFKRLLETIGVSQPSRK